MDETKAATRIQAAFRGFSRRMLFNSVAKKVIARNSFLKEHDELKKRLELKLTANEALKKAVHDKIDPSREVMVKAAVAIQRAWKHNKTRAVPKEIKDEQKRLKMTCLIQRAVRKWATLKKTKTQIEQINVDYSQAAFDFLKTPAVPAPAITELPPFSDKFPGRLIDRSRELRKRLEDPMTIFGAASKSLLPRARAEIHRQIQTRNFQVHGDAVSRADIELLDNFEKLLVN